jgi:hypothetical protein
MPKKNLYILFLLISVNLLTSLVVYSHSDNSQGQITIGECVEVPDALGPGGTNRIDCMDVATNPQPGVELTVLYPSQNEPVYMDQSNKKVFIRTNYTAPTNKQEIIVRDARNTGHFTLTAHISQLKMDSNNLVFLPLDQIGFITYAASPINSVDSPSGNMTGGPLPSSWMDIPGINSDEDFDIHALDPVTFHDSFRPFTFSDPVADLTNPNAVSQEILILQADSSAGYMGEYHLGFGLEFNFPENSLTEYDIGEGTYSGTLTFTLIPS